MQPLPFQREDREVAADTLCSAAGWGTVTHSGKRPDRLQEVQRPVISRELCNHRTRHDRTITEKMMCTDSRKKDTCKVGALGGDDPMRGPGEEWEGCWGKGEGVGWDGVASLLGSLHPQAWVRRGVRVGREDPGSKAAAREPRGNEFCPHRVTPGVLWSATVWLKGW